MAPAPRGGSMSRRAGGSDGETRAAPPVLRVGLTGGIATGKSEVGAVFREEGAFVVDADSLGHALMEPGTPGYEEILRDLGGDILTAEGRIDRQKLGAVVFQDPGARLRLERILHPKILAEERRLIQEYGLKSPGGIAVTQAALLVEAGVHKTYDRLVVTHCPSEIQVRRLKARDGIDEREAMDRIRAQGDPVSKIGQADYVIDTSGDLEETREKAREVYFSLCLEWEGRKAIE